LLELAVFFPLIRGKSDAIISEMFESRDKENNRKYMPYDTRLTGRAKELRKRQTEAETKLWSVLREKKIAGYKFIRQKPILNFILDFYCSKLLLGIEVDGSIHREKKEYDEQRTKVINSLGIRIIRFKNGEVFNNIHYVKEKLLKEINLRENQIAVSPDKGRRI